MMSKSCEQMHMKLICMLGSEGQAAGEEIKARNDGDTLKFKRFPFSFQIPDLQHQQLWYFVHIV